MLKVLIICSVLVLHIVPAAAFPIPERLEFVISYSGIPAGRAVQEVFRKGEEIHIVSTARSAAWLNVFFPVDDRIESILVEGSHASEIGVPRLYRERISEGRSSFHKEAVFDRQKREVATRDFLKKTETVQSLSLIHI